MAGHGPMEILTVWYIQVSSNIIRTERLTIGLKEAGQKVNSNNWSWSRRGGTITSNVLQGLGVASMRGWAWKERLKKKRRHSIFKLRWHRKGHEKHYLFKKTPKIIFGLEKGSMKRKSGGKDVVYITKLQSRSHLRVKKQTQKSHIIKIVKLES